MVQDLNVFMDEIENELALLPAAIAQDAHSFMGFFAYAFIGGMFASTPVDHERFKEECRRILKIAREYIDEKK